MSNTGHGGTSDPWLRGLKKAEQGDHYEWSDQGESGLLARVNDKGRITFVLVARIPKKDGRAGSRGRRVLGDYKPVDDRGQLRPTKSGGDALTFEGARQKAREWKSMIAQGKDPGAKATVVVAPAAPKSFEAVYNEFMKRHVRKEGQKDARGKHFLPLRSIERIITSF